MTKFVHVVDRANSGLRLLLVLGFAALALIGVAQVAARYLFGAPLVWSEEVIRYGLIWLVFAGAGVAARLQAFMAVEILIHATPRSLGRAIALAAGLIGIGVWIMLAVLGVRILSDLQGISVGALETPIVWLYLAVPVGAAWAAVNTLAALLAAPPHGRERAMIGLLLGGSLAGLFALGVPIALALTLASALALQAQGIPLNAVVQRMFTALDSFPLAAIPFFILAGCLMERSGISLRLVAFARAMIGRRTGGLALVTVVAAMFFSAISGSSAATTAAIGTILIPAMVRHGYPRPFATSVQAASGELGVIIPPSIPMIIFALTAGVPVSIGDMFIAGIVPGLLIALSLMLTARLISQRSGFGETAVTAPPSAETDPAAPRGASGADAGSVDRIASRREAFLQAALALLMPILVLGGIYGGVFTPTEAAMAAVGYAFVLGAFVYRSLTLSKLYAAFSDALIASVAILTIIAAANLFGWVLTINQIPGAVTAMFLAISDNPIVFLLMVNLLLLLIGMFLETGAAIIILAPTLTPVAMAFGIPPVHFGIVMIVNLAIGMTTPPLGVNLFVACQIAGLRVEKILRSMLPFYAALLLNLLLITYLPALSLTLPSLLR